MTKKETKEVTKDKKGRLKKKQKIDKKTKNNEGREADFEKTASNLEEVIVEPKETAKVKKHRLEQRLKIFKKKKKAKNEDVQMAPVNIEELKTTPNVEEVIIESKEIAEVKKYHPKKRLNIFKKKKKKKDKNDNAQTAPVNIEELQLAVKETTDIMRQNIETLVTEREENLSKLLDASTELEMTAVQFKKQSTQLKKKYKCKERCPCLYCCCCKCCVTGCDNDVDP